MVKRTRRDNRMKKYLKMPMLVLVICILLVSAFSGCKNQTGQNGQDAIKCAVMSRFDMMLLDSIHKAQAKCIR